MRADRNPMGRCRCTLLYLSFAISLCSTESQRTASQVHLLVAIHRNVPEQDFFLENLQRFLTLASRQLREVTGRAWIDSVTVQVPSSWRRRRYYGELDADFYQVAQVRVVPSEDNVKPRMEVVQPLPCGMPGEMLIVPDAAIMHQQHTRPVSTAPDSLAPEHEFVHLWPRFRYGIFDEIGIPGSRRFPMAVTDNDTVFPVSLSKGLAGVLSLPDGTRCAVTPTGMVRPDCHLFLELNSRQTLMSLLRMPYAAANNPLTARYLPTQHNVLCQRRSTSEIIYAHEDFTLNREWNRPPNEPRFRFVRPRENATTRVVLLLDASEGMCRAGWMRQVHRSVSRFIQSRLPDGTQLALMALAGGEAHILANLTQLEARSRRALRLLVPYGCGRPGVHAVRGLNRAVQLLKGAHIAGAIAVLVTHEAVLGGKNETAAGPWDTGLIVSTVALGSRADPALELLAARMGGMSFWVPGDGDAYASLLDDALADAAQQLTQPDHREVIVRREELRVRGERQVSFVVDAALGADSRVAIVGSAVEFLAVRVRDPDDELYHEASAECTKDVLRTQSVVFSFPSMKPGRWTVQVSPIVGGGRGETTTSSVTLLVTSRGVRDKSAVQLRAQASASWVTYPVVASLHARLSRGNNVVLGASVWASVSRPRRRHVVITLYDDGIGADTSAGDGIYSAFFTDHSGAGRYHLVVRAAGDESNARATLPHVCRSSLADLARKPQNLMVLPKKAYRLIDLAEDTSAQDEWASQAPQAGEPCAMFERYVDAGSFQLVGYRERSPIGPGAVSDLLVEASTVRGARWMLELSWTAMGSHLDAGVVEHVELRCSRRGSELEENFRRAVQIRESDLLRGSLKPLAARKQHRVAIQVPARLFPPDGGAFTLYLAVRTQDVQGRESPLSNVARATHPGIRPPQSRPSADKPKPGNTARPIVLRPRPNLGQSDRLY
ncbi:calcium-activated chloride channel regulator 1-like [Dermacentor andersoni]|uniref:calcium-activated chloride channel regulator 1-like n=1 Tax=Dermacentor andersoni TaxID=34620 RepID=UPI00215533E5|nr:calcium-activated chloride channel regulator 1-like [Dermacentor andersoni]XP_054920416.1 calcium-activated chloride channel regulator 1-like [Dermacentor andersoni]